jgi:excisionase family DNA binding protein
MSMASTTSPPVALPATISVPQAALLMNISIRSAYRMVEADVIPVIRIGRRILVITAKLYTMLGLNPEANPVPEHPSGE